MIQNKSLELSFLLSLPAAFGLLIASEEIVNCLFGYGSFGEKDVFNTSLALTFFAIGVPAFASLKFYQIFILHGIIQKCPFIFHLS